ncbi:MAG TPA: hypothetical protein VGU71_05790 [Candidatus Dormibacteraeota bacterium]|nr:hypothetical protein [Candidatus Dormibacteraeota bacterium]
MASCQPAQPAATATPSRQSACPIWPETTIHFPNGSTALYWGKGPFYFASEIGVGDFNKNSWAVDAHYRNELVVRGHRIDNVDVVNFGYTPSGALPPHPDVIVTINPVRLAGVPVSFTRQDAEGRTWVYQPELHVAQEPGQDQRGGAQYWSFPSAGCYVIEATGMGVNQSTKVAVR